MKKNVLVGLIILVLCTLIVYLGYSFLRKDAQFVEEKDVEEDQALVSYSYLEAESNGQLYTYNTDSTNILLIGTDGSEGENISGQADFMVLIHIDSANQKLALISLPRDTMCDVGIYDSDGEIVNTSYTHLALAYPYGGPTSLSRNRACVKTVSEILNGIPVDYYITGGLDMLDNLVDLTGECDIILDDDSLAYLNEEWVSGYNFHIDRNSIETYLRSRDHSDPDSPLKRQAREVKYLNHLVAELLKDPDGIDLSSYESFLDQCQSNLTVNELSRMLKLVENPGVSSVTVRTIPGTDTYDSDYVEYHIDEEAKNSMILETFYEIK